MAREHNYFVYMLASRIGGTLYVGVTSDIAYRVSQHREGVGSAFTASYGVKRLVWYEHHGDITSAIARKADQAVAAQMQGPADRGHQSELGRSVSFTADAGDYWVARSSRAMTNGGSRVFVPNTAQFANC